MGGPPRAKITSKSQVNRNSLSDNLSGSLRSSEADFARFVNREQFKDEHYEINIVVQAGRVRKFIFDHKDVIFGLTDANPDRSMSNICVVCEKDIQKKERRHCDFCGSRACEKCMHKRRRYMSHLEDEDERPQERVSISGKAESSGLAKLKSSMAQSQRSGNCCKICDRKFFMYQTFAQNREQISELESQLAAKEKEAIEKEGVWKNERAQFRQMQEERDFKEEQFLKDQHTYKKEIDSLRDKNCELVLRQQELAQTKEQRQDQLARIEREI